ncbi:MAG: hypothetical protein EOP62_06235 [Sphingomonadales bacterium]|nr:MAG: hypothetical protein EOP62_06235 [Sphingomonadales bacterium]
MNRLLIASALAASLIAPVATGQDANTGTRLAECRLALRDAMQAAMKYSVTKRETNAETGDMTVVVNAPGLIVLGHPSDGMNITRAADLQSVAFVTRIALDYAQVRAGLPKAYGKNKCDAGGAAFDFCSMMLSDDISMGAAREVSITAEAAEGSGTMLTCSYLKKD